MKAFPVLSEARLYPVWVSKGWAFLWLVRFIPSTAAGLAILAGLRLSRSLRGFDEVLVPFASTFLVTSGCSAWNDYCDRKVDAVNVPYRPLPAGLLSPRLAVTYSAFAFIAAILLASMIGMKGVIFYLFAALASLVYSPLIKPLPVAKNPYVGVFCASLMIFGGYLGGNTFSAIAPAAIVFVGVTGREVLIDIHDLEGDVRAGYQTLPILFGVSISRRIVVALLGLTALLEVIYLIVSIDNHVAMLLMFLSIACFIGVTININRSSSLTSKGLIGQIRVLMTGILLGAVSIIL